MKIYTKKGDKGKTTLADGTPISKTDPRIETYGTLDELNSFVGLAVSNLKQENNQNLFVDINAIHNLLRFLDWIQNKLYIITSTLAGAGKLDTQWDKKHGIKDRDIVELEKQIDEMTTPLPELNYFIIPGGITSASALHLARTVCRRGERMMLHLIQTDPTIKNSPMLRFINRLSDYFFTAARYANHLAGKEDEKWIPE